MELKEQIDMEFCMVIISIKPLFPTKSNMVLRNKNLEMHWISYLWGTATRLKILGNHPNNMPSNGTIIQIMS